MKDLSRPQLEFVVDNQSLAEIANGVGRITNEHYRMPLSRIQYRLRHLYRTFEYKARFLDPVDWRAREFNMAADHVANCVLRPATSFQSLHTERVRERVCNAVGV